MNTQFSESSDSTRSDFHSSTTPVHRQLFSLIRMVPLRTSSQGRLPDCESPPHQSLHVRSCSALTHVFSDAERYRSATGVRPAVPLRAAATQTRTAISDRSPLWLLRTQREGERPRSSKQRFAVVVSMSPWVPPPRKRDMISPSCFREKHRRRPGLAYLSHRRPTRGWVSTVTVDHFRNHSRDGRR